MTEPAPPEPPQLPLNYAYATAPRGTNGYAIASVVLGFFFCIPFATGLGAITFGIFGIRKSRSNSVGGRGLAIIGILLGVMNVLIWGGYAGLLTYGYIESKPAGTVAKQFLQDVSSGNIHAAMSISLFNQTQLQPQHGQMVTFGALRSVNISSFKISTFNGQVVMHLGGTASFANVTKTCTFALIKMNGTYKVTSYWVQ